jgi:tRNA/tmRNA/rRNA uracil-C5-methylase (TrmA/RlmC/RlmD family)
LIDTNTDGLKKISPLCPVFYECGGCQYQDISYDDELHLKEAHLKSLFQDNFNLSDDIFRPILASPQEYYYRNRLDLKLVQTKSKEVFIGFSPKSRHRLIPVESCPIARHSISNFIPSLNMQAKAKVTEKYRQANLVVRTGDDGRVFWGGIGRRSLELQAEDYLWTEILGKRIFYSLDTFFQANLFIVPEFIKQLRALDIWDAQSVFYDLYGGVGLFGVCVYDLVGKVVLIEEVQASLKLARHNVAYHKFENFFIHDGRVEDVLPSLVGHMPQAKNIVMVDPPRAGLSEATIAMLNSVENVNHLLYLSCNPQSLLENCKSLKDHWSIRIVLPLDFFPRTQHLETLVLFEKAEKR